MYDQIVSEYVADHLQVNFCVLTAMHSWKDGFITTKCPGLVIKSAWKSEINSLFILSRIWLWHWKYSSSLNKEM